MKTFERERSQAQYKRALYLSLYGRPNSLQDEQKAYIKQLLRSWMFPSISSFKTTFGDIVKAHSTSKLLKGMLLFPFRAPYFFIKAASKASQPAQLVIKDRSPDVRRFTHIDVNPVITKPSPKKTEVIHLTPHSGAARYVKFGFG